MQEKSTLKEKLSTAVTATTPAAAMHSICCGIPAAMGIYAGKEGASAFKEQTINHLIQAGENTGFYQATPAVHENPLLKHTNATLIADEDLQAQLNAYHQNHESAHTIYHGLELTAMVAVGLAAHKLNKKFNLVGQTKDYLTNLRNTNP